MIAMHCYAKCWACNLGEHGQCGGTWADDEDIEHAKATGQDWERVRDSPCGCSCRADVEIQAGP